MGVLLCILGTVVRYKIISVDDQRFGQILFLGFLKKDVTINSILTNNRDSGEKEEAANSANQTDLARMRFVREYPLSPILGL